MNAPENGDVQLSRSTAFGSKGRSPARSGRGGPQQIAGNVSDV